MRMNSFLDRYCSGRRVMQIDSLDESAAATLLKRRNRCSPRKTTNCCVVSAQGAPMGELMRQYWIPALALIERRVAARRRRDREARGLDERPESRYVRSDCAPSSSCL